MFCDVNFLSSNYNEIVFSIYPFVNLVYAILLSLFMSTKRFMLFWTKGEPKLGRNIDLSTRRTIVYAPSKLLYPPSKLFVHPSLFPFFQNYSWQIYQSVIHIDPLRIPHQWWLRIPHQWWPIKFWDYHQQKPKTKWGLLFSPHIPLFLPVFFFKNFPLFSMPWIVKISRSNLLNPTHLNTSYKWTNTI